jgi:hypothetical protein
VWTVTFFFSLRLVSYTTNHPILEAKGVGPPLWKFPAAAPGTRCRYGAIIPAYH